MNNKYYEIDTFCDFKNNYSNDKNIKKYFKELKKLNTRFLYYQENEFGDLEEIFTKRKLYKRIIEDEIFYVDYEAGLYINGIPKEISLELLAKKIRVVYVEPVEKFFNNLEKINKKDEQLAFTNNTNMLKLKR